LPAPSAVGSPIVEAEKPAVIAPPDMNTEEPAVIEPPAALKPGMATDDSSDGKLVPPRGRGDKPVAVGVLTLF